MFFYLHLQDPTIAAQTDSVHRVVGVGDCKHLEEEDGDEEGEEDGEGEEQQGAVL